jgi:carotenoid cleavage dioxygenase
VPHGIVKEEIEETIQFILGFMPWILFLFISGHSFASLEHALLICLAVCLVLGFKDLRKGFLLRWGTLLFFVQLPS